MANRVQCVVVGAGVVGLATARAMARSGVETVVLEACSAIGMGTSSRNSEVIHAWIYYPKDSHKARFCVEGRRKLYDYCDAHGVPHKRCGKLIVATSLEQNTALRGIKQKAEDNGVEGMRLIEAEEACSMEPELYCTAALHSPATGIVDSHSLMLAYQGEAEQHGAMIAFDSALLAVRRSQQHDCLALSVQGMGEEPLYCDMLVNAAGLQAPGVAAQIKCLREEDVPSAYYAKGNYYRLQGASPFSMLVYPVPEQAGLGVHATIDLGGQTRFGPDVEWVQSDCDYDVDPARADSFYAEVRKYWPALSDGALLPDYAGIRPKLQAPGTPAVDFVIQGPSAHGVPGLVNMFGIESPGLTCSLALGEYARDMLLRS